MILPGDFGSAVTSVFRGNPRQRSMEVSLDGLSAADIAAVLDEIATQCAAAGIGLKGIVVDAGLFPRPADAPFVNAWYRHGALIIADLALNDALVVRRA